MTTRYMAKQAQKEFQRHFQDKQDHRQRWVEVMNELLQSQAKFQQHLKAKKAHKQHWAFVMQEMLHIHDVGNAVKTPMQKWKLVMKELRSTRHGATPMSKRPLCMLFI